jgi:PE family
MDYTVDPDELRRLARGLESVHAAIGAMGRDGGPLAEAVPDAAVLGSIAVADALRELGANWSKARARIRAELDGTARALDAAAGSYGGVESGLVTALEP